MNKEGSPSNIFEEAGKPSKGKNEPTPPPPEAPTLSREEINKLIHQIYQQHDLVERKLDELYQKSGFNPHSIDQFLENPQNLTEAQRQAVEQRKAKLDQIVSTDKGKQKGMPEKQKKGDDTSSKRKGKTLGGRKGWISM